MNKHGYRFVYCPGHPNARPNGNIAEHRLVMSLLLCRPLYRDESVHHINGVRGDNSPPNLELWSRGQPAGQRVVDKLAWARVLVWRYGTPEERAVVGPFIETAERAAA